MTESRTVSAVFRRMVERRGDCHAVAYVGDPLDESTFRWWTYADVDRQARSIAGWLTRQALPGSRVLLLYPAGGDFVTALLGCFYAGMVAVPSSMPGRFMHDQRRVLNIARDAKVSCVLTVGAEQESVRSWAEQTDLDAAILATDTTELFPLAADAIHPVRPDSVAVLQYTSGSTSDPKGVVITHENLLLNAASVHEGLNTDETSRFGGWIPNYHDMGLMGHILPPLVVGGEVVLMSPATFLRRPVTWLQLVDRFDLKLSAGPSFAYELCLSRVTDEEIAKLDLSGWQNAANGSEPVNPTVLRAFTERFAAAGFRADNFSPCYGMAEATLVVSAFATGDPVVRRCDAAALAENRIVPAAVDGEHRDLVSCGAPVGIDLRIVDPATGEELADGRIGEIWLSGPSVAQGYWQNPAATAAAFGHRVGDADGFLRTGDLGTLLDGEVYVTGRIKDMIIVRGRNIYPHDVEQELRLHHPELRDRVGAVFTVPAGDGSPDGRLVVTHEVQKLPAGRDAGDLIAGIRHTVSREFGVRPHAVLLLRRGAVRRTTSGKIQRSAMRGLFQAGELQPLHADGYSAERMLATIGEPQ
ncbi:fatty acyl-AMP ligase [Actinoplanes sp. NPDC020271]|uniref:fatty acyl-AMP ligase n=1 Tax=Actinoplanes sp. NPDC020271 TaxID=3363896 RepID=UPI00378E64D1